MTALKFTTAETISAVIMGIALGMMLYHLALNIHETIELNRKEKEDKIKNENRDPDNLYNEVNFRPKDKAELFEATQTFLRRISVTDERGKTKTMKHIKFKYADQYSNWEWRYQECTVESVEKCIEIYGLGVDCEYEILSVEDVNKN